MPRRKRKRNGFLLHLGDGDIDMEIDKWIDKSIARGFNCSEHIKNLLYRDITGLDPATGLPLVVNVQPAYEAPEVRDVRPTDDPAAKRLLGVGG